MTLFVTLCQQWIMSKSMTDTTKTGEMNMSTTIDIAKIEENDELCGFIYTLSDGRIVQVQFSRETNRLHADYNTHKAHIDDDNEYGLNLTDLERDQFNAILRSCDLVKTKALELDAEYELLTQNEQR